jgi:hypothetical protein
LGKPNSTAKFPAVVLFSIISIAKTQFKLVNDLADWIFFQTYFLHFGIEKIMTT